MKIEEIDELKLIDDEIKRLNNKKNNLIQQQNDGKIQLLKSLVWTKECNAKFAISIYEFNKYILYIYGPYPKVYTPVVVMGEDQLRPKCVTYYHDFNAGLSYFYTPSKELLFEFLNKVTFKELEYNENDFEVLEFVKNKVDTKLLLDNFNGLKLNFIPPKLLA